MPYIIRPSMKERDITVVIVATSQLQTAVFLFTSRRSIKGRNTAACFVIHSLHTKKVLQDTFKVFMKVESITVKIVVNNFLSLAI